MTIVEILNNSSKNYDFQQNIYLIFGDHHFRSILKNKYGDMECVFDVEEFEEFFDTWKFLNGSNYVRIYQAYMQEYNPIHNYDGTEKVTTEYIGTESVTSSLGSQTTNSNIGASTSDTVDSSKAFDSTTFKEDSKSVTTNSTQANSSTIGARTDSSSKSFSNRKDIVTTEKGGNLGVTTTQKMLTEEKELRLDMSISEYLMQIFVLSVAYY